MPRYELRDKHDELKAIVSYACAREVMDNIHKKGHSERDNDGRLRYIVDSGTTFFIDDHISLAINATDYLITKR